MRRSLVLTSEHAGHPFRRSLPPHVTRALPFAEPEVLAVMAAADTEPAAQPSRFGRWLTKDDVGFFVSSYLAAVFGFALLMS